MPPSKGKKKGKKKEVENSANGGIETNEMEETERRLKAGKAFSYFKETQKEEKAFNEFQQQREKLNYFWIVEKKKLEDSKAELRNKERELQDLEEKHQVEIKVYKQKVKHLLFEQRDELSKKKYKNESLLKKDQEEHGKAELYLKADRRTLRSELNEKELSHDQLLISLKREQDENIRKMRQEFEGKSAEVRQNYEKKSKCLREELEERRKHQTASIEDQKNQHIQSLMRSHTKAFADIKNYYNDITHNNLDLIKSLKEEVSEMRRKQIQDEKLMENIATENRRMSEPFKKALADVDQYKLELEKYEQEKSELREVKARLLVVESQNRSLKWQDEILRQRFDELKQQRDALTARFAQVAAQVKQKSQFKHLLLQKKIEAMSEKLETRDAQLDETLQRANISDAGNISALLKASSKHDPQRLFQAKTSELNSLRSELERVASAHVSLVKSVQSKMEQLGVPKQELGFFPTTLPHQFIMTTQEKNKQQPPSNQQGLSSSPP